MQEILTCERALLYEIFMSYLCREEEIGIPQELLLNVWKKASRAVSLSKPFYDAVQSMKEEHKDGRMCACICFFLRFGMGMVIYTFFAIFSRKKFSHVRSAN